MSTTTELKTSLTTLEEKAIRAAYVSSEGNGHDFGVTSDVIETLRDEHNINSRSSRTVFANLSKKGFIDLHEGVKIGDEIVTQFELTQKAFWFIEESKEAIENLPETKSITKGNEDVNEKQAAQKRKELDEEIVFIMKVIINQGPLPAADYTLYENAYDDNAKKRTEIVTAYIVYAVIRKLHKMKNKNHVILSYIDYVVTRNI